MKRTLLLLVFLLILSISSLIYFWLIYPQKTEQTFAVELFTLDNIPVLKDDSLDQDLALSTEAVYALDLDSMTVLYDKNANEVLFPASTSKMMTALVATDIFDLEQELLVIGEALTDGNKIGLREGQIIKVRDLLAALLIFSANDSAYVLANNSPRGYIDFIEQMNQKAANLGLTDTHFSNPAGLDEDGQKSTARDLALIARELLKQPYLKELVATPYQRIEAKDQTWKFDLYNSNQLLGQIQGVRGVKTGTTELAGQVLVTLVERDGHQILLSLMNSQDRYLDTSRLLAWILNNYEWRKL